MPRRLASPTILAVALAASTTAVLAAGDLGQERPDQWRTSKLAGVAIYGPDNRTVGKISDVLMSRDGKAEYVVVGVGGFLGLGEKDVAIPFDQVRFSDQPIAPPANPVPADTGLPNSAPGKAMSTGAAPGAPATAVTGAAGGGIAPATPVGLGTPADPSGDANPPGTAGTGAGMVPRSTAYPDHGVIDRTADQLKSAPTFRFAN